jgi:hypothetical protein
MPKPWRPGQREPKPCGPRGKPGDELGARKRCAGGRSGRGVRTHTDKGIGETEPSGGNHVRRASEAQTNDMNGVRAERASAPVARAGRRVNFEGYLA